MRAAPTDREQKSRAQGEAAIAPDQQLAAVVEIGGVSGEEKQREAGQKLGQANVSEIERALGDLVHLPSHSDGLHLERYDDEEPRERIGDEVGIGEGYSPGKARVFGTGREHSLLLCHRIICHRIDWRGLGTAEDCKINHGGHRGAQGNPTGKTVCSKSLAAESEAVDERGDVACAESVIDVYYADVRGAGVHHPEQSG